jgi:peptide/nickel transport system substrate-binding protein
MIESGEAAITGWLPPNDVEALKANDKVVVHVEPSWQNLIGMFNTQKPPLDNVKVRQALAYAMPYDEVIKTAAGGYARQSYGIVPYGMWGYSEDLPRYSYDLDKAKALLEEAGMGDGGFTLTMTYLAGEEPEKMMAELYKSELAKLNITLDIRSMPWDSAWEMAKGAPDTRQDIFVMYWWPDLPSPYSFMFSTFHSEDEPFFNLSYYKNPEFDALIDGANEITSTDQPKAESMFVDAQKILLEDAASLFIYDRQDLWVTVNNLKGFKYNPAYPMTMFYHDMYFE